MKNQRLSRRRFLHTGALLAGAGLSRKATAANDRINIGTIGVGGRGGAVLFSFLSQPDAHVVAVCDVDRKHYRDLEWGEGRAMGLEPAQEFVRAFYERRDNAQHTPDAYTDYREVCARDDIDAIVVATPDHWHALITLEALRNGKDVYCEKPVTHLFHEGQSVYREVAKRDAVFQAGSQQRSEGRFRHAVELVRNGHLGTIKSIEVGLPPGYEEPMGDPAVTEPRDTLDYDRWCGPSPVLPYMRARHHRWWRGHRAYGGGVLMDWIGHHNDIAHWSMDLDKSGPKTVEVTEWTPPKTEIYNTPHHYALRCTYDNGVVSTISSRNAIGTKWIGEDGWLYVRRGETTASNPEWAKKSFDPGKRHVMVSDNHFRNFLDAMRTRSACVAPAETAHRSITPGHLAYVAKALNKTLEWDPVKERILNADEGNTLLHAVDYREPWTLEHA